MGVPHIPLELIYEILGHLQAEKPALQSCSLVCKAWVNLSRSHLWADVVLDVTLVKKFHAFSQRSTVVIPYIRHFCLHDVICGSLDMGPWNDCISDLVGFHDVKSLSLYLRHHRLNARARSTLCTQFTGIVRLWMGSGPINENHLADMICSFPRLEALTLHTVRLLRPPPTSGENLVSSPRTISRHLHTLDIVDVDAMIVLAWILAIDNISAITTLNLRWCSNTFETINDLLPNFRSLERLAFSHLSSVGYDRAPCGSIDLSHHERLRSLHIREISPFDHTQGVIETLASINSTCMDEIVFDISPFEDRCRAVRWSEVDAFLQSPRFSNLRTVQLHVTFWQPPSSPFVDPELLASFRLSQCRERGILSVQTVVR